MASQEHVEILKQGAEVWQRWRQEHASIDVDLSGAMLAGADLRGVDLSQHRLRGAVLAGSLLAGANLKGADLEYADMSGIQAPGADLSQAKLLCADLSGADLSAANLAQANLRVAKLGRAKLRGADLRGADLSHADLHGADLRDVRTDDRSSGDWPSFMASPEHLALLQTGSKRWNEWRRAHPQVTPRLQQVDLAGADLQHLDLRGAQMVGADLRRADLSHADLTGADLSDAHLDEARLFLTNLSSAALRWASAAKTGFVGVNLKRACLAHANLRRASMRPHEQEDRDDPPSRRCDLSGADLSGAMLQGIEMRDAVLEEANLSGANFDGADLTHALLSNANLSAARLCDVNLAGADLSHTHLKGAVLQRANLTGANLIDANLQAADLASANLAGADLSRSVLVEANLTDAALTGARVYGVAAWNVALANAAQHDLVISRHGDPMITVDDLEVAQFIYLMLNNSKIRNVIDSITSKGVLILGRFADPQRKAVLDGLREKLREFDLLPMVFDFDRPTDKDYTETVQTLAGLSMFVIVDVTSPKSTPLELEATVKQFKIPYLPIIDLSVDPRPFAMLVDSQKSFHWVLDTLGYTSSEELLDDDNLKEYIVDRAMAKRQELRTAKNQEPPMLLMRKKVQSPSSP